MPTRASNDGVGKRDAINDLDCPDCGRWFATFTQLAEHVTTRHTKPESSGVWPGHKRHYQQDDKDEEHMAQLPRSTRAAATATPARRKASSGNIPGSSREEANDYNAFLKAQHIGRVGSKAKIILTGNVRVSDGVYGEQIIAEAKLGRVTYDWAVKLNTPNHRWIEDNLGLNTAKWKNKIVTVEVKENLGRDYIAIAREHEKAATKKKKTAKRKVAR